MSQNISRASIRNAVNTLLHGSTENKRNFVESVELQVALKNYDPRKDKRFSGSIRLKHVARPRMKICILGDEEHCEEATVNGVASMDVAALKGLNKDRKVVKRMFKQYDAFLASDTLIRQIPRILGPRLGVISKFPSPISHSDSFVSRIVEIKSTIKFQLKKHLNQAAAIGHTNMSAEEMTANAALAINFLVSLLKKKWQNVRSIHIKSTMGRPQRLY